MPTSEEQEHYVDPILFSEGVYADQADYERSIDAFAERINLGVAPPLGREPKSVAAAMDARYVAMREAIASMPSEIRLVLDLHYFDGMEYSAIAEALHLSTGTVKSRAITAIRLLAAALGPSEDASRPLDRDITERAS